MTGELWGNDMELLVLLATIVTAAGASTQLARPATERDPVSTPER